MNWTAKRLKYTARVDYGLGQPPALSETGIPILRATNVTRGKITSDGLIYAAKADLPLDRAPLLREGEILVVRSGAYTGDSALITNAWAGSAPGYDLRVTPIGAYPAYIAYCLLSKVALDQVDLAKSRAAQPHLNAEDLGNVTILLPSLDKQCKIADFLDAETGRIDGLAAARQRMRDLLLLRRERTVEQVIGLDDRPPMIPLKYVVQSVSVGIVITPANWYVDKGGVPALRGLNVQPGRIDGSNMVEISHEGNRENLKSRLSAGDVVVVRTGQAGTAAVVPAELDGSNCIDLLIIRPGKNTDSSFLTGAPF
jgi:type I restriction enzyme S subunit